MESAAIRGAGWVLHKALSPLSDGLVELWAASTELEPNIEALKTELLCAQGILHRALGVEIHNPMLAVLLQKLRGLGYEAENALGELDYFRIQDEIDGSSEAVEDLGCGRNLVRVVRHVAGAAARQLSCDDESCKCARRLTSGARNTAHVASAAAKQFCCASCLPAARGSDENSDEEPDKESDQEYSCKCGRRLASRARTATRAFEVERFTKQQEEALSLLTSLQLLQFWCCDKLRCLPAGLRKLTSLERLRIYVCPAMRSLPKNGLPSSLQELHVENCIKLRCLPAGLHKLTSLKRLEIYNCPAIRSLPKNGLPSSLQELDVSECENEKLKQRCRRLVGTIPLIRLG